MGRGRSGIVYRSRDESRRDIARKVFGASGLTKAVQYVFLGAPNPYAWSESAIRAAVLRRRILTELVEFWFGSKLGVARAYGYGWNERHRAFEMRCELIEGRHVALHHPYSTSHDSELHDALRNIMKPLQARLAESGFDGLVWQAGRGNPVALNNFLCEGPDERGGYRWVWIDLESGVPALVPMNPVDLFLFYLPKSVRHGRPLFDDVDLDKLRRYVLLQRESLRKSLGDVRVLRIEEDIDSLADSQRAWKSLARHLRSIGYARAKGFISCGQADWYGHHPYRWYGREACRAVRSSARKLITAGRRLAGALLNLDIGRMVKPIWYAVRSQRYREKLARDYVSKRIVHWRKRGQLEDHQADLLRRHVQDDGASAYLTDFGVHLAVKPMVKAMQFWVMPALWMAGAIDDVALGIFLVAGGSLVRTLYTLVRLIQNGVTGREKPWAALIVGAAPVIGNLAFPFQMIMTGTNERSDVGRFILYDTFSRFGRWFPIWGGADTLTEHVLNRCPDPLIRLRHAERIAIPDVLFVRTEPRP